MHEGQVAPDRWLAQSTDNPVWLPKEQPATFQQTVRRDQIIQAKFELPYGMEAASHQQPEFDTAEPADLQLAPPSEDPFQQYVPEEAEAAPAPAEVIPYDSGEFPSVYNEPMSHAACCRPKRQRKSMVDRLTDVYAGFGPKGEKVRKIRHWLWDQTYLFRIRNAEQSRALHHESFYEPVRPTALPNYGHYPTLWRRFEEDAVYCPTPEFGLSPAAYPSSDGWEVQSPVDLGPGNIPPNAIPLPPQPAPPVE